MEKEKRNARRINVVFMLRFPHMSKKAKKPSAEQKLERLNVMSGEKVALEHNL